MSLQGSLWGGRRIRMGAMTNRGRGEAPHCLGQAHADSPGGQRPQATPLSLSHVVLKGKPR